MVDVSESTFNMQEQASSEVKSSLWEQTLESYRGDPAAEEYLPTIRMMAPGTDRTLQEVSKMLEEVSRTLQRLEKNERAVSMDAEMEATICSVYQGVIGFYVRAHDFFRAHEQSSTLHTAWLELRNDFQTAVSQMKQLSSGIENEVELSHMRVDPIKYQEVLKLMANFHPPSPHSAPKFTHYVPFTETSRFWGRSEIVDRIGDVLLGDGSNNTLRSFALYGMGGVGKTQIALRYANEFGKRYDCVFWVSAENLVTIGQSFREIAKRLGLITADTKTDDNSVMLEVKQWLSSTKCRWLLVYDNADDLNVMKHALPTASAGSVLITSRDSAAALTLASSGCQVTPFDIETGSAALLNILGLDLNSESNQAHAKEITSTLGGLPLALNQIGGFIAQRKIPLENFLSLYEQNSASVDAKSAATIDYSYTLATVWEMAQNQLSGNSKLLHMILSFLDPDCIHESMLSHGAFQIKDTDLEFLTDEMNFLDAQQILLQGSLINKSSETGIISMHRLVQRAAIRRMCIEEREKSFSLVVAILAANFPNTYSADVGHQVASWSHCQRSLPHIESIVKKSEDFKISESANQPFAELLLRGSWYLYERESYSIALSYVDSALRRFENKYTLAYASAIDLRGLIQLDIHHPSSALNAFEEAYRIRRELLPENDAFLAASQVHMGLAFTELGELEKARDCLQQSIDIRLMHNSDRIGNSYSNMASLLLRMGKPREAEVMLKSCPSLKDFSDETLLQTGNPRFSGDMILLSRIRFKQGLFDEALRFASKALNFRRETLGKRLKVCDSLYEVATLLSQGGQIGTACKLLEECIQISGGLPEVEGMGHLARANYKLSQLLEDPEKEKQSSEYLQRAMELKEELDGVDGDYVLLNAATSDFEHLVPWMLW